MNTPRIAIILTDTLAAIGLADIIRRMMPKAEAHILHDVEKLAAENHPQFFHFFTDTQILMEHAAFFLSVQHRTIVLIHGDEAVRLPQGFHTLNVRQTEEGLIRSFLRLAGAAHGAHGREPEAVKQAKGCPPPVIQLTTRETEVLRLVAKGLINKQIADHLGMSTTTAISHRKNLTKKLGIKSISALTIYAVTHGLIKAEEV